MKRGLALICAVTIVALGAVAAAGARSSDTTVSGAGSTFVAPLVSKWTPALGSAFGYTVQYSGVGSGAGIAAITNRQVDFGASDAPMSPDAVECVQGLRPDPVALAATTVAYNVPGAPAHLQAQRCGDREHLPRQDHELERPGDRSAESGLQHAEPEDHSGLPV